MEASIHQTRAREVQNDINSLVSVINCEYSALEEFIFGFFFYNKCQAILELPS